MSAKQLGKLERLAGKRVEQSRLRLENEARALQKMDQHHSELHAINTEYQQAVVGKENVAPTSLAHRRMFVTELTQKLDQLLQQREVKEQSLQLCIEEYKQRIAEHTAMDVIHKHSLQDLAQQQSRREQQQLDEYAGQRHHLNPHKNFEDGYD